MPELLCFLVDDDEDDREIFAMALEAVNVPSILHTAKSGEDAIQKLNDDESFIPDYIFLDLNMPGMHGTQCLKEIKKIPRLNDVPVIIYSTSSNPLYEEETLKLNAVHYFIKPTSIMVLTTILTNLFEKKDMPFYLNS